MIDEVQKQKKLVSKSYTTATHYTDGLSSAVPMFLLLQETTMISTLLYHPQAVTTNITTKIRTLIGDIFKPRNEKAK